jgi:hypothetical protein
MPGLNYNVDVNRISATARTIAATLVIAITSIASAPKITVEKWGEAVEQPFDPNGAPQDLPKLTFGHAEADAKPWVEWKGAALQSHWDSAAKTLVVTDIDEITISGHTNVRLPQDAPRFLRDHEYGHDTLNSNEYFRSARAIVAESLKGLITSRFVGAGADDDACRRDARAKAEAEVNRRMNDAIAKINERMDALATRFDDSTNHGRSSKVDTKRGIEIAIRKRDEAAATRPATRAQK